MSGGGVSGCQSCRGACCRAYVVPLCGHDAIRITREQQLPLQSFARLIPEQEHGRAIVRLDRDAVAYTLVLNRRREAGARSACVFLLELAGYARCGIYDQRPFVCRTYPAELHNGAVRIRDDVMCPDEAWNVAGLDLPVWREELLRMELEWAIYERVVARFNSTTSSAAPAAVPPAAFYAWLLEAYARLEPLRTRLGIAGLTAAARDGPTAARGERQGPAGRLLENVAAELAAATPAATVDP